MSHHHNFHTIDDQELDLDTQQVRHIEFTTDARGENIIVVHRKDTGKEFVLDGENEETREEITKLLKEAGIY